MNTLLMPEVNVDNLQLLMEKMIPSNTSNSSHLIRCEKENGYLLGT